MSSYDREYGRSSSSDDGFLALVAGFIILMCVGVPTLVGFLGGYEKTNGGEVAVVRNGGFFDNKKIRQVIEPGSGRVWTGWWSETHKYPSQQRFYTITANKGEGDKAQADDKVTTPTADGVNVDIEGTLYFSLNTEPDVLRSFDDKFGTRKFAGKHPYDGDEGFRNFLNTIIRPVIDNNLREQIGSISCAELVSSCTLVQSQGNTVSVDAEQGKENNSNIQRIQSAINISLAEELEQTLGGPFLKNLRFNLVRVTLPPKVQEAVDEAQAAFGRVSQAEARVKSARLDAAANRERQKGYRNCPTCARIDQVKAIPPTLQTYAPGGGFAITSR